MKNDVNDPTDSQPIFITAESKAAAKPAATPPAIPEDDAFVQRSAHSPVLLPAVRKRLSLKGMAVIVIGVGGLFIIAARTLNRPATAIQAKPASTVAEAPHASAKAAAEDPDDPSSESYRVEHWANHVLLPQVNATIAKQRAQQAEIRKLKIIVDVLAVMVFILSINSFLLGRKLKKAASPSGAAPPTVP